jgi:hypothetical protein
MKKILVFLSLMISVISFGQKDKGFHSNWCDGNTNITGMADDNFEFFKKGNFLYYISNDGSCLYINIKIEDSGIQYKILQEGLTVWINADGKTNKDVGIRYPIGVKYSKGPGFRETDASGSPVSMANTIELIGFDGPGRNRIPAKSEDDFNGNVEYDKDGNLFYCLKVPVSKLNLISSSDGSGFEPFTIGIEYGNTPVMGSKPTAEDSPQMSTGMSGGGGRGGGGRGGAPGGRGGAPGGGMGGSPSSMPAPTVEISKLLWIKDVCLAEQP